MYNAERPDPSQLPSTGRLLRSTLIAAAAAATLLTLVVMPAEYGVDPTGVGRLLGLTEMGAAKVQLAKDAAADQAAASMTPAVTATAPAEAVPPAAIAVVPTTAAPAPPTPPKTSAAAAPPPPVAKRREQMTVSLTPNQGTEVKLEMREGQRVRFSWSTSGPPVNFDAHGEAPGGPEVSYKKGAASGDEGELVAAFDGIHGWFWRNRSGEPLTITVTAEGDFALMKQM
jgi:hypothetical protein